MPVPALLLPAAKSLLFTVVVTAIGQALSPAPPPPPQGSVEVRTATGKVVRIQPHPHQQTRVSVSALGGVNVHADPVTPTGASASSRAMPRAQVARGGTVRGAALQALLTVAAERLSGLSPRDATAAVHGRKQASR